MKWIMVQIRVLFFGFGAYRRGPEAQKSTHPRLNFARHTRLDQADLQLN